MVKVTVCGAAGGIGQPLSLLLKINPNVSELALFDVVNVPGVGADLSHINTDATTSSHLPSSREDQTALADALKGTDIVIIPAGVPRKPGMTRDDLFNINAGIIKSLATGIAKTAPNAFVLVISNPVNSTVPIVAETLKSFGVYDPKKLFGVTTLDIVRANTFISQLYPQETKPTDFNVNVVGGHSGETIVPLYSLGNSKSYFDKLSDDDKAKLINRVQFGGDEVVKAKDGAGSATLSMAQAGARFAGSVLNGLAGEADVIEPTFVDSPLFKSEGVEFFSSKVTLGPEGVLKVHELGELSSHEEELVKLAKETLIQNIKKGVDFVKQNP